MADGMGSTWGPYFAAAKATKKLEAPCPDSARLQPTHISLVCLNFAFLSIPRCRGLQGKKHRALCAHCTTVIDAAFHLSFRLISPLRSTTSN